MRSGLWCLGLLLACGNRGGSASAGNDSAGGEGPSDDGTGETTRGSSATTGAVDGSGESDASDPSDPSAPDDTAGESSSGTTSAGDTTGGGPSCVDGALSCMNENTLQECQDGEWGSPQPCPMGSQCLVGQCLAECAPEMLDATSLGCSFFGARSPHYTGFDVAQPDSMVVGNPSEDESLDALFYFVDNLGMQIPQGPTVTIPPGESYTFEITLPVAQSGSLRRIGGFFHVETTRPAVAYQHSPLGAQFTNDASLLLPEHVFGTDFVVASRPPINAGLAGLQAEPLFVVIAMEDETTLEWLPTAPTASGLGVPGVAAGDSETITLAALEYVQISGVGTNTANDITGTWVSADKPVWFLSAHRCALIRSDECDHLQEQLFPLEAWGETYVAAHVPPRGNEVYVWRFFAGTADTTLTSDPPLAGFPLDVPANGWVEYAADEHFTVAGTEPFLAVQYVVGHDFSGQGGAPTGGPSIVQAIPVEQFLERYPLVTGTGYDVTYLQVIRSIGGDSVFIDGDEVDEAAFQPAGASWEVADVTVAEGPHFVDSASPIGVVNVAYYDDTSYAYPGGGGVASINPQ